MILEIIVMIMLVDGILSLYITLVHICIESIQSRSFPFVWLTLIKSMNHHLIL